MHITTYKTKGREIGVAAHDVPPEEIERLSSMMEQLPGGSTPWEAETLDSTLSLEYDTKHQARAAVAYLHAMYPLSEDSDE